MEMDIGLVSERQCGGCRCVQGSCRLISKAPWKTRRALQRRVEAKATAFIDFKEGEEFDAPALKDLIRSAVAFNLSGGKKK
jgi:hypothetical protein